MGGRGSSRFITILQGGGGVSRDSKFVLRNIWTAPYGDENSEGDEVEDEDDDIFRFNEEEEEDLCTQEELQEAQVFIFNETKTVDVFHKKRRC